MTMMTTCTVIRINHLLASASVSPSQQLMGERVPTNLRHCTITSPDTGEHAFMGVC